MQTFQTKQIIAGVLVIIAVGVIAFVWYEAKVAEPIEGNTSTPDLVATTTPTATTTSSDTPPPSTSTKPSLTALIDQGSVAYQKGDYTTARARWETASTLYPQNYFSFASLAQLYEKSLVDYAKAEANYKKALTNTPPGYSAGIYQSLYEFYLYTLKKDALTLENTLKEAIQKNPKAVEFRVLIARRYKDAGRTEEAKAQFDAAIQVATTAGNTSLANQLQVERDSL